jgi:hypothetical protein
MFVNRYIPVNSNNDKNKQWEFPKCKFWNRGQSIPTVLRSNRSVQTVQRSTGVVVHFRVYRIRCLGGVSIPCRAVAPAVSPCPLSWMQSYPLSKLVCQVRSNCWNEKCQTTYGSRRVCNYELDHCNGHRTCKTPTSNETAEIPVLSTCLSVVYSDLKIDCM